MFLKERWKGREDKEEDVFSYWVTLKKEEKVEFETEITKPPFCRTCFRRDYATLAERLRNIYRQI
jgi:molybdenum cofactor biosynthesis enzyme MoaA